MENITIPPGKVSPLIKGARWTLLFVGIVYGATRLKVLTKKEVARREIMTKVKAERDAVKAAEKARKSKEEQIELSKLVGLSPPEK